jgi:hypothetical protein
MAPARTRGLRSATVRCTLIFKRDIRGTAPDFRPFERPERCTPFDALEPDETLGIGNPGVQTMGLSEVRQVD